MGWMLSGKKPHRPRYQISQVSQTCSEFVRTREVIVGDAFGDTSVNTIRLKIKGDRINHRFNRRNAWTPGRLSRKR